MPARSSLPSEALDSGGFRSEGSPTVLVKLDEDACVVWANGPLAGQSAEALSGTRFAGLWPRQCRAAVERALDRARGGTLQRVGVLDPAADHRLSLLVNRSVTNEPSVFFFVVAAPRSPELGGPPALEHGLASPWDGGPDAARPSQIVIADDESLLLSLSAKLLELEGYEVELVASGDELLDRLERDDPLDLVVLDLSLPGPSPASLLRRIEARHPRPAVLVATGSSREQAREQLGPGSHWRYLQKPYANEVLVAHVEELLEGP